MKRTYLFSLIMTVAAVGFCADVLPTYNMSDNFVKAVRADYWQEHSTKQTTGTQEYGKAYTDKFASPANVMRQPTGALSGKLIFLLSGHGWTYNENTQSWYTQRGINHGLVEDHANQDQATIFADFLWSAGATIIPLRPVGHQPEERILGSGSPRVSYFGSWFDSDSTIRYGGTADAKGAKFAEVSLTETALARFTPFIAVQGLYPVYVWNRDGNDRVNQTYRVRHAEGITEVLINHRRVGKGWMYLGTFPFSQGETGCVEITNKVIEPYDVDNARVVLAEAVRFGNGLSNANLGAGIVGDTRETEGSNFWLKDSLGLGVYDRLVGESTVGDPPKMSAHMNRENEGSYFDRLYWSFHSNASGNPAAPARGAVALWNLDAPSRTDFQEPLARITGNTFADDMGVVLKSHPLGWSKRANATANHINFGEIRRDYLQNEMASTLMENAFHDNFKDASLLLEPNVRIAMARASLNGIIKWLSATAPTHEHLRLFPATPTLLSVKVPAPGQLKVTWYPSEESSPVYGDPAEAFEVSVIVNSSTLKFRVPAMQTSLLLEGFTTASLTNCVAYVQAVNTGGTSMPSGRLCATPGAKPTVLIADAFTSREREMNRMEGIGRKFGDSYQGSGIYERLYLPLINPLDTTVRLGDALTSVGISSETVRMSELDSASLSQYQSVYILTGNEHFATDQQLPRQLVNQLRLYAKSGGKLVVAGNHAASMFTPQVRQELFGCDIATTQTPYGAFAATEISPWNKLEKLALYKEGENDVYRPTTFTTFVPKANNAEVWAVTASHTALPIAVKYAPSPQGKCVLLSFGPELIRNSDMRSEWVLELEKALGNEKAVGNSKTAPTTVPRVRPVIESNVK